MTRVAALVFASFVVVACSSSNGGGSGAGTGDGGSGACPDASGTWKIGQHCDASLVGQTVVVTQSGCSLTFAAPFNGFTGTIAAGGALTVTGPQSCSGTASATAISMSCTPGTCTVTLAR